VLTNYHFMAWTNFVSWCLYKCSSLIPCSAGTQMVALFVFNCWT